MLEKPARIAFDCEGCSKNIQLNEDVYNNYYKGFTLCLSCRPSGAKQDNILTEDELDELFGDWESNLSASWDYVGKKLRTHSSSQSAYIELQDQKSKEWMEENERLKEALNSILNGNWACYLDADKLEVWETDKINPWRIAKEALEGSK